MEKDIKMGLMCQRQAAHDLFTGVPMKYLPAVRIWEWSLQGRKVFWRVRRLRIMKDGKMAPVPSGNRLNTE
jgi:hypothetical protein